MVEQPRTWARRLHSLFGIVPVGVFLLFHLIWNASSTWGADAYDRLAHRLQQFPLAVPIEIFLIALPLSVHGVYGLFLTATTEPVSRAQPHAVAAPTTEDGGPRSYHGQPVLKEPIWTWEIPSIVRRPSPSDAGKTKPREVILSAVVTNRSGSRAIFIQSERDW